MARSDKSISFSLGVPILNIRLSHPQSGRLELLDIGMTGRWALAIGFSLEMLLPSNCSWIGWVYQ